MILKASHLSVRFGARRILDDVSFGLEPGRTLALMGPNGAGKTTLLRCLLGLVRFEGRVEIDGLDLVKRGVEARSRIGYVPQAPAFYDMKAGEWLRFMASLRGASAREVKVALERVGLQGDADRPVKVFSGGMQQRISIAAALLGEPPVMLLDEPTANLDPAGRQDLLGLLRGFRREGKTLILSSHRSGEVSELADRVLVLEGGAVRGFGPPSEVIPHERLALRIEAPDAAELRRVEGLLRLLDIQHLETSNGGVTAVVGSERVVEILDSLRSDGVAAERIRLRGLEEGAAR